MSSPGPENLRRQQPARQSKRPTLQRPTGLSRRSTAQRHREALTKKYWIIRDIVDENDTHYLIDWEDDPDTGESFPKNWEPKENVTSKAVLDWESKKKAQQQSALLQSSLESAEPHSSLDSEPITDATRKRRHSEFHLPSSRSADGHLSAANKRPRKVGTVHTARFSTSQEDETSQSSKEISDSCEADTTTTSKSITTDAPQILIPYDSQFDGEAYDPIPSSQPNTQITDPAVWISSSAPEPLAFERRLVVPDSQDVTESSYEVYQADTVDQTDLGPDSPPRPFLTTPFEENSFAANDDPISNELSVDDNNIFASAVDNFSIPDIDPATDRTSTADNLHINTTTDRTATAHTPSVLDINPSTDKEFTRDKDNGLALSLDTLTGNPSAPSKSSRSNSNSIADITSTADNVHIHTTTDRTSLVDKLHTGPRTDRTSTTVNLHIRTSSETISTAGNLHIDPTTERTLPTNNPRINLNTDNTSSANTPSVLNNNPTADKKFTGTRNNGLVLSFNPPTDDLSTDGKASLSNSNSISDITFTGDNIAVLQKSSITDNPVSRDIASVGSVAENTSTARNDPVIHIAPATYTEKFLTQIPFVRENLISEEDQITSVTSQDNQLLDRGESTEESVSVSRQEAIDPLAETADSETHSVVRNSQQASATSEEQWQGAQLVQPISAVSSPPEFGVPNTQTSQVKSPSVLIQGSTQEQNPNSSEASLDVFQSIELEDSGSASRSVGDLDLFPPSEISEVPETYGGQYLPRPQTPSDTEMADNIHESFSSRISRFRESAQAQVRAERVKGLDGFNVSSESSKRSASAIPAQAPPVIVSPIPTAEASLSFPEGHHEQPLESVEDKTPIEPVTASTNPPLVALPVPPLQPTEHIVLLPMNSTVREIYEAEVRNHKRDIESLVTGGTPDTNLVERLQGLVPRLNLIADHQDLVEPSSSVLEDSLTARWAETASTKCMFVRELLDALRPRALHVAILARPGQMLDILEIILKVTEFSYVRPDISTQSNLKDAESLRVTLLATGLGGAIHPVRRADIIIAFDETFRIAETYSRALRIESGNPGEETALRRSILLSLVVANSAEHIELCLAHNTTAKKRFKSLIACIWQKRKALGKLDLDYPLPDKAAELIADYVREVNNGGATWPLPDNLQITGVRPTSDGPLEQRSVSVAGSRQDRQYSAPTSTTSVKRNLPDSRIAESNEDATRKRLRMTPLPADAVVTDPIATDVGDATALAEVISSGIDPVSDQPMEEVAVEGLQGNEVRSAIIETLLSKVAGLERDNRDKDSINEGLEGQLADHRLSIRRIQPKYMEALGDRGRAALDSKDSRDKTEKMQQRLEARIADISKLKDENAALRSELAEARDRLINSSTTTTAEAARSELQVRTLQEENARLEKRLSSLQKDFDFTRDCYQKASSAAAEAANELSELKGSIADTERRASKNIIRIHELQTASEMQEQRAMNAELKALLRDREQELHMYRKNEELRARANGRRETRGASVPRSPRIGTGNMSPYVRATVGSRGNSPAPGTSATEGHADPVLFSSSGSASHRWQHLT